MGLLKQIDALDLAGTAIHASYVAGNAFAADRAGSVRLIGKTATGAASNSTSAQWKLQGSPDGVNAWADLPLSDVTLTTPALATSISKNTGSSAFAVCVATFISGFPFLRVAGQFTGGVGKAGETLSAVVQLFA